MLAISKALIYVAYINSIKNEPAERKYFHGLTLAASCMTSEIDTLKEKLFSTDRKIAIASSDKLAEIGGVEITDYLISLLSSNDSGIRNIASLTLRTIGDSKAVDPLFNAIQKPENQHYNGTLVFALQTLNCSKRLLDLFDLLFYSDFEVRMGVVTILQKQIFDFSEHDLIHIQNKWLEIQRNPDKCPEFDKCKEDIDEFVNAFVCYLDE